MGSVVGRPAQEPDDIAAGFLLRRSGVMAFRSRHEE